jgi:hypothetical protein
LPGAGSAAGDGGQSGGRRAPTACRPARGQRHPVGGAAPGGPGSRRRSRRGRPRRPPTAAPGAGPGRGRRPPPRVAGRPTPRRRAGAGARARARGRSGAGGRGQVGRAWPDSRGRRRNDARSLSQFLMERVPGPKSGAGRGRWTAPLHVTCFWRSAVVAWPGRFSRCKPLRGPLADASCPRDGEGPTGRGLYLLPSKRADPGLARQGFKA